MRITSSVKKRVNAGGSVSSTSCSRKMLGRRSLDLSGDDEGTMGSGKMDYEFNDVGQKSSGLITCQSITVEVVM